jgi:hypothetical protein
VDDHNDSAYAVRHLLFIKHQGKGNLHEPERNQPFVAVLQIVAKRTSQHHNGQNLRLRR